MASQVFERQALLAQTHVDSESSSQTASAVSTSTADQETQLGSKIDTRFDVKLFSDLLVDSTPGQYLFGFRSREQNTPTLDHQ